MNSDKLPGEIYIVDDDVSVCRALSILLGTYGFTVKTFTSADRFFRSVPYDVQGCLVLDIHMSEVDGWETLRRINRSKARLSVIIISADKTTSLNEQALKAGADGYLQKPFDGQALVDLINAALEKKSRADKAANK
jgi:FixJ family two-component response regulator